MTRPFSLSPFARITFAATWLMLAPIAAYAGNAEFAAMTDAQLAQQAEKGNADAALTYGKRLLSGSIGTTPNPQEAAQWFRRAAQQSNAEAAVELVLLYQSGSVKPPNDHTVADLSQFALKLLYAQADKGSPAAMAKLGQLHAQGLLVKKDTAIAKQWLEKAVAGGDAQAKFTLGRMTLWGDTPEYPQQRALDYIQQAADTGIPDAWLLLGMAYSGAYGGTVNHARAFDAFQHASSLGMPEGTRQMGIAYLGGFGVAKDEAKGFELTQEAAQANNPDAMLTLAQAYQRGVGTTKNPATALTWLTRAAATGYSEAEYRLGLAYLKGEGTGINTEAARRYFTSARDKEHVMAKRALEAMDTPQH